MFPENVVLYLKKFFLEEEVVRRLLGGRNNDLRCFITLRCNTILKIYSVHVTKYLVEFIDI